MVDAFATWQRFAPLSSWLSGPLAAIARELDAPETRAELDRCEREEHFPARTAARLHDLGLAELFAGGAFTTACHIQSLNAIAAQASGSLAVSLGITGLALLPAYLAATPEQLSHIGERVLSGARAAMLLSEWATGSNLAGTETRAERMEGDRWRISGEKQLINLVRRSDLLMTLVRTGGAGGLGGTGGLSLFLIERDDSVELLPRWRTVPVPAADIGGARFRGTEVPASSLIGGEGDGFRLVQAALTLSRGGISAFASGTASRACALAFAYAGERAPYGEPIARLDAVADHLVRMAALDLAAACIALKAAAAANALGPRAAYHTAVAKLVGCDLAERAVAEGRAVLGARALLAELPYQQVVRDVVLYGVFDGTRHLMLDHVLWRMRQIVRGGDDDGDRPGRTYNEEPAPLVRSARQRGRPWLPRPARVAAALGDGAVDTDPLAGGAAALEAAVAALPPEALGEQSTGFAIAGAWAELEAAVAVAELADPVRRARTGLTAPPPAGLDAGELARFAVAEVAGGALAAARRTLAGCGVDLDCAAAERALALMRAEAGRRLRGAVRE